MGDNLKIVSAYQGMPQYIKAVRAADNPDKKILWRQFVLDPYWDQWAAGQFNEERTRREMAYPIEDIDALEEAVKRISASGIESMLHEAYAKIVQLLPLGDEEKVICVLVNPGIDEALHGVLGNCIGDSILIQVNPAIAGWPNYIPWVLAHEYNHTVWGYNYYYLKGNHSHNLLTAIITEGEADSFGKAVSPDINPSWVHAITAEQEKEQWSALKEYLFNEDGPELHNRFIFGGSKENTPRFTGYTIGYHIVQMYLKAQPEISFMELAEMEAEEILKVSGYEGEVQDL